MEELIAKDICNDLKKYITKCTLLDVREPEEFEEEHIEGAINIPLAELNEKCADLKKDREIILICLSGMRAKRAGNILQAKGYTVKVMKGGMIEWRRATGISLGEDEEGE